MALTPVDVAVSPVNGVPLQIPRVLITAVMAAATGTQGFAFTQGDAFRSPKYVEVGADVDIYWADTDAAAVTLMRRIPAGSTHRIQINPGATTNYFIRCASTANVVATVEA